MSKADRDRQALLQRLAREQRRALNAAARDADRARTPRTAPTPRRDDSPPSRTSEQPSAQSAARLKSLTPLYKQRQQRRLTVLIVIIIVLALALTVVTGTLSASLALLGDAVDSASLYLNRADGGWPTTTGITEPLQIEPLADGFVELGNEDVLVYSAYGSKILSLQPSYARPVLAVGGTHFVVYNRAGSELTVCSRTRTLYTQRFDEDILLCAMSNNNSLAVVTDADRFAGWVHIYDPSMRELYSWRMPQSMGTPIALDFAPDNRRFASGMIAARDGQLNCSVYFMSLDSDTEGLLYTADAGSMLLRLDWQSENRVMAVFDTYIAVIDPRTAEKKQAYAEKFAELRAKKGVTLPEALEQMNDATYFGTMMVKMGDADGLVSGACHSTANTLRPALQILKTAPGTKLVSAFFIMCTKTPEYGAEGTLMFADCGLNIAPTADELSEIAIASAESWKAFMGDVDPKIAMLSFSTKGSAKGEVPEKVQEATKLAHEKAPELALDGDLQLDAALVQSVADLKAPNSSVAGNANILVFPDLEAGNIGYKLVQRFGGAEAYGPVLQGIAKPVNDLSRGCSADDIVGVVAITAVQAQMAE